MNIWIIDHYSVPVKYYPLARQRNFARYLMEKGHEVTIFCASSVHNSTLNLIEDNRKYIEVYEDGIHYVIVKCHQYEGNGIKRVFNMLEFAIKFPDILGEFDKPQAIISTSMTQFACAQGIRLARKYNCKVVAQITDLWPEALVSCGFLNKRNPIIYLLRMLEKWTYKNADSLIFSMEGAYDYICSQRWQNTIPKEKVNYINNGVDLDEFNYNKENCITNLEILNDKDVFKVVYTGSIRHDNNVGKILDVGKKLSDKKIVFLLFGQGDQIEELKGRIRNEKINNVYFLGNVEKKYIPYIVSKADLNFAHNSGVELFKYGISMNKIFDYFAAGKPIITDFECAYNPVVQEKAGVNVPSGDEKDIAKVIYEMSMLSKNDYEVYCNNSLKAAEKYDYERLTDNLEKVINIIK